MSKLNYKVGELISNYNYNYTIQFSALIKWGYVFVCSFQLSFESNLQSFLWSIFTKPDYRAFQLEIDGDFYWFNNCLRQIWCRLLSRSSFILSSRYIHTYISCNICDDCLFYVRNGVLIILIISLSVFILCCIYCNIILGALTLPLFAF